MIAYKVLRNCEGRLESAVFSVSCGLGIAYTPQTITYPHPHTKLFVFKNKESAITFAKLGKYIEVWECEIDDKYADIKEDYLQVINWYSSYTSLNEKERWLPCKHRTIPTAPNTLIVDWLKLLRRVDFDLE